MLIQKITITLEHVGSTICGNQFLLLLFDYLLSFLLTSVSTKTNIISILFFLIQNDDCRKRKFASIMLQNK